MDLLVYSKLNNKIEGIASGVTGHSVNGLNLTLTFVDGTSEVITFTQPKDGVSISKTEVVNDELVVTMTDGSTINCGSVKGPKGDKGDTGNQGPKGDTGDQGAQGPQGLQGIQGIKGDKGDTGSAFAISKIYQTEVELLAETTPVSEGLMVAVVGTNAKVYIRNSSTVADVSTGDLEGYKFILNLTEATVIKGDKGEKGERGAQGIQGPQGLQGIQGVPGEKGEKGDPGETPRTMTTAELETYWNSVTV